MNKWGEWYEGGSFRGALFISNGREIGYREAFSLSCFLCGVRVSIANVFQFTRGINRYLTRKVRNSILSALNIRHSRLFRSSINNRLLSFFSSFKDSRMQNGNSFRVDLSMMKRIIFLRLLFVLLKRRMEFTVLCLVW